MRWGAPETTSREVVMTSTGTALLKASFGADGVVLLPGVVDTAWMDVLRTAYSWSVGDLEAEDHATQNAGRGYFSDLCNPEAPEHYRQFLEESPIADVVAALWGEDDVWFMYEQVFMRRGAFRRTMWHQDLSYLAVEGHHLAVAWISFEAHDAEHGLEFVRGSHRGPLYNGTAFNPDDPTAPFFRGGDLPRLPDIEAARDVYDIVSFDYEPGDIVLFHPKVLHGGGMTTPSHPTRHSVSLRFFGPDARYAARPGPCGPRYPEVHAALESGDPFRHPVFLKLRPRPDTAFPSRR
jgi:ectoine hydroxylase-related dioxygenase (phytanoyl-CoA dioxygenase family)